MRYFFDGMQAKLYQCVHEGAGSSPSRAYDDGPGGYARQYFGEGPPDRQLRSDNGFNGGGSCVLWPVD